MIKLGNTDIEKVYLGANEINKAYLGNQVIFEKDLAPDYFAMTIDSTKPGSANDKFEFTGAQGQYDVDAVQNDVVQQSYTNVHNANDTITLPSAGIYQVRVKPTGANPFNRIQFINAGDKDKVLTIDSFGIVEWSDFESAFRGCSNLTTSETNPDLSNVTSMLRLFQFSNLFTGDISNWDVSNVHNMQNMFLQATSFNSNISEWNTLNVTNMRNLFNNASSFKQDISAWNVEQVSNMGFMFRNVNMNIAGTTTNYDNLLIKWSQQNVQQNVSFSAGDSKYDPTSTLPGYQNNAGQARTILVNKGWTIIDGGTI